MNYRPYGVAYRPRQMTPRELEQEIRTAWELAYGPEGMNKRVRRMRGLRFISKVIYLFSTLAFRGVYFRQMTVRAWLGIIWNHRHSLREVFSLRSFTSRRTAPVPASSPPPQLAQNVVTHVDL